MSKRLVVVGGATAVAGLVLGASIVFGPAAVTDGDNPNLPGDIDAPGIGSAGQQGELGAKIVGFEYTTFEVDSDGQLRGMRLLADRANLKPLGITELIKPHAEIRLGSQRAITITADQADMEMEDSKPRAGQFTGNVIVTLAQAPDGTRLIIDPQDPAHEQFIQQRIYLDEATDFSIEEDTINTQGPVHATSPQVDFFGIGLRLAYNTQRQRIEQLVINEGRYLIYNPDAQAPGFRAALEDEEPPITDDEQGQAPVAETGPTRPSQFYAADFFGDVLVRDGIESELAGDSLSIDFSLGTEAIEPKPIDEAAGMHPGLPRLITLHQHKLAQADTAHREGEPQASDDPRLGGSLALPVLLIPDKNAHRSLFKHVQKRDIVVTWTGRMQVYPHAIKPEILADEKDVRVTLAGDKAYAQTTRNGELERLETGRLEYLASQQRTTAFAKPDTPTRILSEALGGELSGQRLTIRQQQGTATVQGPGQLTYTNQDDGKTLTLTWQDRLDLELYTRPENEDDDSTGPETRILGVKTATFDGQINAKHTDFDLNAERLTIAFDPPDKAKGTDNTPTAINAMGSVKVLARGDAADETFEIQAQRLSIDLELDEDNEPFASAIRALDDVHVKRPGSVLTCQRVEVELNAPSQTANTPALSTSETSAADTKDRFAQVRSIVAVGDVRAELDYDERRIDLIADQLIADVERDRLTLSSDDPSQPAEVFDIANQRKLTGRLVVMDDQAEVLTITDAGSLATRLSDPNDPEADIEDAFLAVAWDGSMRFNNITGLAEFKKNVRSESRRSTDASDLSCDELTMQFSPDYEHDPARLLDDDGKDTHERQVRSAIAVGNVKFNAAAWNPIDNSQVYNRMRLQGPRLIFTNQPAKAIGQSPTETLVVDGQGIMVLEDYRPPKEGQPDEKLAMTGRGATLFNWKESMTLDALSNTATLIDTVQMTHIPKDAAGNPGEAVQLDCNKLVADLLDTGGLSVWLSDDAPEAQVSIITADENVRLSQQGTRTMSGDHMKFEASTNRVELRAEEGRDVIIKDEKRDNTSRTNKVMWDLTTDRIKIDQLRGGVAPLN